MYDCVELRCVEWSRVEGVTNDPRKHIVTIIISSLFLIIIMDNGWILCIWCIYE